MIMIENIENQAKFQKEESQQTTNLETVLQNIMQPQEIVSDKLCNFIIMSERGIESLQKEDSQQPDLETVLEYLTQPKVVNLTKRLHIQPKDECSFKPGQIR